MDAKTTRTPWHAWVCHRRERRTFEPLAAFAVVTGILVVQFLELSACTSTYHGCTRLDELKLQPWLSPFLVEKDSTSAA